MKKKKLLCGFLIGLLGLFSLSSCSSLLESIFSIIMEDEDLSDVYVDDNNFVAADISDYEVGTKDGYSKVRSKNYQYELNESRDTVSSEATGNQKILVLPITIRGYESNATETNRQRIEKAFFGETTETSWESVASYYSKSSYGKLNITGEVAPWYSCGYSPREISNYGSEDSVDGVKHLLEEAVANYKRTKNTTLKDYDTNGDGFIDSVWLIYSCPNYSNNKGLSQATFWAFTYWDSDTNASTRSPSPKTFAWASYDFMNAGYGTRGIDSHTYIHETGHIYGLEDYYDYDGSCSPLGGIDMMDYNIIDHNCFSKWALGWVEPYVIDKAGSITLKPASTSGDCAIIPSKRGWNGSVFDEYILIEYYTPTALNQKDSEEGYESKSWGFSTNGVRIYHVDARLARLDYRSSKGWSFTGYTSSIATGNSTYTELAHSNTPDSGNVTNNNFRLIQMMDATLKRNFAKTKAVASNTSLFKTLNKFNLNVFRSSFPLGNTMNCGYELGFSLSFSNLSNNEVKVTISEN